MLFAGRYLFGRRGTSGYAARAAVVAHAVHGDIIVDDGLVVGIVHHRHVHIGHRAVIHESATAPISARIPHTCITKAVVDSAVKSDVRAPVTGAPNVYAITPAPITRSP